MPKKQRTLSTTSPQEPEFFYFKEHCLRQLGNAEAMLFVAQDAADMLGIQNSRDAVANFPEDEIGVALIYTNRGPRKVLTLTEPGLYRLIFRSDKPEAERFRRWIFHEVIPAIRKTGTYSAHGRQLPGLPLNFDPDRTRQAEAVMRAVWASGARKFTVPEILPAIQGLGLLPWLKDLSDWAWRSGLGRLLASHHGHSCATDDGAAQITLASWCRYRHRRYTLTAL